LKKLNPHLREWEHHDIPIEYRLKLLISSVLTRQMDLQLLLLEVELQTQLWNFRELLSSVYPS
jgi:hypothetical protein